MTDTATTQQPTTEITKILIANRGEIALRVIHTARSMGIRTVAVHSDADRDATHVIAGDEAVRIGTDDSDSSAPSASYLNIDALLNAAKQSGADAVHPGYGFLSERAQFARACVDAGLVFIGPDADVIEAMGRKDHARRIAEDADVPVLQTYQSDDPNMRFPVLVKAAAGGGGKGMRIVRNAADLPDALAAAGREAKSAFGDGTLLVERYVEHGRHVEVQIMADMFGTVLHLGERDCSVQRRHQKVVEESPAPTISTKLREQLLQAAVRLAKQVGYVNAGTVEFLVADDEFFLLEMNTRLQVEHPVTELVTGLDLVELQIRIAKGEPLPLRQADITFRGHAIEVRVYAEDAEHGFLPQAGRAGIVTWPADLPHSHRHGRTTTQPPPAQPTFPYPQHLPTAHTSPTDHHLSSPNTPPTQHELPSSHTSPSHHELSASAVRVDAALRSFDEVSPWYDPMIGKVTSYGPTRESARRTLLDALAATRIDGLTTNLGFLRTLLSSTQFADAAIDTSWLDRHPDLPFEARLAPDGPTPFDLRDGWRLAGPRLATRIHSEQSSSPAADASSTRTSADAAAIDGTVRSPMPGTVIAVKVTTGQHVSAGEPLGVVEAMKMEHTLTAPHDGVVEQISATVGDRVSIGAQLFLVAPADPATTANAATTGPAATTTDSAAITSASTNSTASNSATSNSVASSSATSNSAGSEGPS